MFITLMAIILTISACNKIEALIPKKLEPVASYEGRNQMYPADFDARQKLAHSLKRNYVYQNNNTEILQLLDTDEESAHQQQTLVNEVYSAFPIFNLEQLDHTLSQYSRYIPGLTIPNDIKEQLQQVDFNKNIIIVTSVPMLPLGKEYTAAVFIPIAHRVKKAASFSDTLNIDVEFAYNLMQNPEDLLRPTLKWQTEFYIVPHYNKKQLLIAFKDKALKDEYTIR
ncbi:hypothetical protein BFG52_10715 [Acinetobacter larvae]|uniref:Uncharacterized protein n=2 Tax=Acinetobacter larvae TaxID=1789224 RepID=A0A1B2M0P0_9GAMM|nr:hypothetical protein BFG52_10715 [Acinetobacter larvae]